jgi:hypothetical protein
MMQAMDFNDQHDASVAASAAPVAVVTTTTSTPVLMTPPDTPDSPAHPPQAPITQTPHSPPAPSPSQNRRHSNLYSGFVPHYPTLNLPYTDSEDDDNELSLDVDEINAGDMSFTPGDDTLDNAELPGNETLGNVIDHLDLGLLREVVIKNGVLANTNTISDKNQSAAASTSNGASGGKPEESVSIYLFSSLVF